MRQRVDPAARLLEATAALSSDLSLRAVLERVVELAVEITDARYGALGVLGPDGAISDFITVGVSEQERARLGDPPRGAGILGLLIAEPRPIRLDDLTQHAESVGFPPNHPPMRSFLGVPVQSRGEVFGNLYLTEKVAAPAFTGEDEEALVLLASHAGIAIANARLYEEAQRRGRWLDAVGEIATTILAESGTHDTLRLVAARARGLVDGDDAAIALPASESGHMVVAAADGDHAGVLDAMSVPREGSASGDVMRTGRTAVFEAAAGHTGTHRPMVAAADMGPAVFVPLQAAGMVRGTLAVSRHSGGRRFVEADINLLESFADQAALALEAGRAREERRRLELIEDRERIAKDLHDGVIQALFAVGMSLQGTAAIAGDERVADRIQEAIAEIDRAIGDLRSYIFGLRPDTSGQRRLADTLDQLAHEFEQRTRVTTVTDLDSSVEEALSRHAPQVVQVVREALSNVARHAAATTCRVSMRREPPWAVVEVDDDGNGFNHDAARKAGMGLPNLRARAESMGGELSIESVSGEGTTVRLCVPLVAAGQRAPDRR